jgi:hypothetical protein
VTCAFRKSKRSSLVVNFEGVIHCHDIIDGVEKFKISFDDGDQQWYTVDSDDDECSYSQNTAVIQSSNEMYRMLRILSEITWENKLWADVEAKLVESINILRMPLSKDIASNYMNCLRSGDHHHDMKLKLQIFCVLDNFSKLFMSKWQYNSRTKQSYLVQGTGNRLWKWSAHTQCRINKLNTIFNSYYRAAS